MQYVLYFDYVISCFAYIYIYYMYNIYIYIYTLYHLSLCRVALMTPRPRGRTGRCHGMRSLAPGDNLSTTMKNRSNKSCA